MSSAVLEKLRGILGRAPAADDAMIDRPTLSFVASRRQVELLAAEIDRLRERLAELEARSAGPTQEIVTTRPDGADLGRLDAAIAALQARCGDLAAGQTAMAAAMRRADGDVAEVRADRSEIVRQLSSIHTAHGQDRARIEEGLAAVRALRDEVAATARLQTHAETEWTSRADELSRTVSGRLAPLYLVSLLALIAALAAIGMQVSRM